jgi:hypothetical protein
MKWTFVFIIFCSFWSHLTAQQAGIYRISFRIEPELVNGFGIHVPDNGRPPNQNNWFFLQFPKSIKDSLIATIERRVSQELFMEAKCVYRLNRKQQPISSSPLNNQLGGFPNNQLKWAIRNVEKDAYVKVNVQIVARGGTNFTFFDGSFSRLRPMMIISIRAHDAEKRKLYSKTVRERDFSSLRFFRSQVGPFTNVNGEVLQAQDIHAMLLRTFQRFDR